MRNLSLYCACRIKFSQPATSALPKRESRTRPPACRTSRSTLLLEMLYRRPNSAGAVLALVSMVRRVATRAVGLLPRARASDFDFALALSGSNGSTAWTTTEGSRSWKHPEPVRRGMDVSRRDANGLRPGCRAGSAQKPWRRRAPEARRRMPCWRYKPRQQSGLPLSGTRSSRRVLKPTRTRSQNGTGINWS
jgi:hypothetical protein